MPKGIGKVKHRKKLKRRILIKRLLILSILFFAIIVQSQTIDIRGTVTDTTGITPIDGAVVTLENAKIVDTSDAKGEFRLSSIHVIHFVGNTFQDGMVSVRMNRGVLFLDVSERGKYDITVYTLQGKVVSQVRQVLDIGSHNIALPDMGMGVNVYRIKANDNEIVFKSTSTGIVKNGLSATSSNPTADVSKTRYHSSFYDVIAATKDGYLKTRQIVSVPDSGGYVIKMIPSAGILTDVVPTYFCKIFSTKRGNTFSFLLIVIRPLLRSHVTQATLKAIA